MHFSFIRFLLLLALLFPSAWARDEQRITQLKEGVK